MFNYNYLYIQSLFHVEIISKIIQYYYVYFLGRIFESVCLSLAYKQYRDSLIFNLTFDIVCNI